MRLISISCSKYQILLFIPIVVSLFYRSYVTVFLSRASPLIFLFSSIHNSHRSRPLRSFTRAKLDPPPHSFPHQPLINPYLDLESLLIAAIPVSKRERDEEFYHNFIRGVHVSRAHVLLLVIRVKGPISR